jgi:hypothetical protein
MWTQPLHFVSTLSGWVEGRFPRYALRRSGVKTSCGKRSRVVVTAPLWSLRATRVGACPTAPLTHVSQALSLHRSVTDRC